MWSFTTGNRPPVVSFTVDNTSGMTPLTVKFTDTSVEPDDEIVSWEWDFDNDSVIDSTEQNPSYTYTSAGTYSVSLKVTDIHGAIAIETKSDYITAYVDSDGDGYGDACTVNHCVANSADLQAALTTARGNSSDNVIKLVQGAYGVSGNSNKAFSYGSTQSYNLVIQGGYTSGCVSRDPGPANTILDGENISEVLSLSETGTLTLVEIIVEGIMVRNGVGGINAYVLNGKLALQNNIIRDNMSQYYAGAYVKTGNGEMVIANNIITGNTASYYGGGIYAYASGAESTIRLINTDFVTT